MTRLTWTRFFPEHADRPSYASSTGRFEIQPYGSRQFQLVDQQPGQQVLRGSFTFCKRLAEQRLESEERQQEVERDRLLEQALEAAPPVDEAVQIRLEQDWESETAHGCHSGMHGEHEQLELADVPEVPWTGGIHGKEGLR